jgi:hypothetical protein
MRGETRVGEGSRNGNKTGTVRKTREKHRTQVHREGMRLREGLRKKKKHGNNMSRN